jgi:probable biosynthetic protein (TIGR04099 family)
MNLAFRTPVLHEPSSRDLMARALDPHLLIGMPHLTPSGLSETWLMKELGHRHWLMLARDMGMDNAGFRTTGGDEAYAAICATSLTDARLNLVRANAILTIRSALTTVSRTQTATTHDLSVEGRNIGRVELISAFVHREIEGSNHSIARVMVRRQEPPPFDSNHLARTAADMRNGRILTYWGLPVTSTTPLRSFRFHPSTSQEFNGAGLFYFAEFQALADRALDQWFPDRKPVVRREVFFLGNIEKMESVFFDLVGCSDDAEIIHGQIRRESGDLIARLFISSQCRSW